MADRIQLRRDTRANWEAVNPVLAQGEFGWDLTDQAFKIGDGVSPWMDLIYFTPGAVQWGDIIGDINAQLDLGSAAQADTGAGTDQVPLNSDLGSASLVDTGTGTDQVRLNSQNDERFARRSSNLSDLTNAATARSNLGLGSAATRNVGSAAGSVVAGDDPRLSDARTPTAHTHPISDVVGLQGVLDDLAIKVSQNRTLIDALAGGGAPLSVFGPNDFGVSYSLTSAYQNVTGTEPAVADGDPVALVVDQSGSGMDATQVTTTARPIFRKDGTGDYLEFDLGDDKLTIDALPAGEYSICLPTREGIYHDTVTHVGGQFDIGPLTYTGGPTDIMLALSDGSTCEMVAPPLLIDRALTATEKDILNGYFMSLGAGSPDMYGDDMVLFAETTTASETFNIPAANEGTFNATVDWGDGQTSTITAYNDAELTHTYDSPGVHRIRISGQFGNVRYSGEGDKLKVIGYANLGSTGAVTFFRPFEGCSNMRFGLALGNTDTSSVTDFIRFAYECASLTTLDVSGWDTSNVTTFGSFAGYCTNLQTLVVSGWDTSSVTTFYAFATACTNLQTLDVSGWDTSSVTSFDYFANSCTALTDLQISNWDISSMTSALNMLPGANNALSQAEYDATLINWESQNEQPNVTVHFGNAQYTAGGAAEAARTALVNNGWNITDGGPV